MPPIKRATPAKRVPSQKVAPSSGDDNFQEWQDKQPVITVTEPDDDFPSGEEGETLERSRTVERPPAIPSPMKQRARSLADRWRNATQPKRSPGRPKKTYPRMSVENVVGMGWGVLAQMA